VLRQLSPRMHAYMRLQLDILQEEAALYPAFPGSAFSTAQFTFGNSRLHTRRNDRDVIHGLRAITVLGKFTLCVCVIPANNVVIRCTPGTTVFIAGSVKDYFFTRVPPNETRYLFEQYFDACVQRWIDRGFRSDVQYEEEATPEEIAQVETQLANCVRFSMKLLSRMDELYV
ncbi:hypothetical protein B0H16DRAFT_1339335, partial [Mycena metata]